MNKLKPIIHTDDGYDQLIQCKNDEGILLALAEDNYRPYELVYSEFPKVREAIANNGCSLDTLCDDPDVDVRNAVDIFLKDNGYKDINEWAKENPERVQFKDNFN